MKSFVDKVNKDLQEVALIEASLMHKVWDATPMIEYLRNETKKVSAKKAFGNMRLLTLLSYIACALAGTATAGAGPSHWSLLRKPLADGTPAERRERVRGPARALLVNLLTPRFPAIP